MAEYIERQSVLAKKFNLESRWHEPISIVLASEIERLPAADVRPVVRGRWEGDEYDGYADGYPVYTSWRCSACGDVIDCCEDPTGSLLFCPTCGADMREATP